MQCYTIQYTLDNLPSTQNPNGSIHVAMTSAVAGAVRTKTMSSLAGRSQL